MRRIIFAAIAAAGVLTLATGCSNGCATDSAPYPPTLTLDASSWFASNPDTAVQVCLNASCNTMDSAKATTGKGLVTVGQGAARAGDATVKVTLYRGTEVLGSASRTVTIKQNPCISMPCGCLPQGSSAGPLRLTSSGQVSSN
ncbi:hypothetical protein ACFVU2_18965 [Leifsonia sp. NPDC058194]|uniref:hypothetical protein n=1 Tax=Leifsonia sp. NPDC058194 TaxID=3346374 RepID=UPI0036D96A51